MANYYNLLGTQTWSGTTGAADFFYLYNKSGNPNDLRVDTTFANFVWNTSLHTAPGVAFQLTGTNVYGSADIVIGDQYDNIRGSSGNDFLAYNNGGFNDGLGGFQGIQNFDLGAGNDLVDLSAHGPGGVAYAKSVKIYAGTGNDVIVGGAGDDIIYGQDGDDLLIGFAGVDTIYAGAGNDVVYGDDFGFDGVRSDDSLLGEDGNDTLYGGGRHDLLNGGNGEDVLYGGWGRDTLFGGTGNDTLWGDDDETGTDDILQGNDGNDFLYGIAGNDQMDGGTGDDLLDGGTGNDNMAGGGGADRFIASAGNDAIDGGTEIDTVVFSGNRSDYQLRSNPDGSVTLTDLRAGSPDGVDLVRNVEWFQFADILADATQLNTPPTITSNGGGATAALNVAENSSGAITNVQAVDQDAGQTITYRILGGADAAWFTINGVTGALIFRSAPDFENPIDAGANNVYDVIVGADDGAGGIAQQQLAISVSNIADGNAPVLAGGPTANLLIDENTTAVMTVSATDPDGTVPAYSIVGGADAALFTIDSVTGTLSFRSASDYDSPADADRNNVYAVIVSASDGVNSAWKTIAVSINNLNDNTPVITSNGGGATAAASIAENTTGVTTVVATDLDGGTLIYAIAGGDDAAFFEIDSLTGGLRFRSAPDREAPADANFDNVYNVTVSASDGTSSVSQALSVQVLNVNDNAPVITSNDGGTTAAISVLENGTALTTVQTTDADGSAITYSLAGGSDAALFAIDAVTGALQFINAPDFEHPLDADSNNTYQVIVAASDGAFTDQQAIQVTVGDVNEIGRTINGNGANENFSPTAAAAYQTTALNDTIFGKGGNDTINGGAGADYMDGGIGNDTYYVDTWSDNSWAADDDQVVEAVNSGTDLVYASVSYRLTANVERLTLTGSAGISGWGNDLGNIITGSGGSDLIDGGLGHDRIDGGDGNDTILGGEGTDILFGDAGDDWIQGGAGGDAIDGGIGADWLEGGADNDTYVVDNAGDLVIELSGGGIDRVNSSVSHVLANEVETLVLTGSAAIDGTGNALANSLTGNGAANHLWGLDGNDIIEGAAGDDMLEGGTGNDTLRGSDGIDTLIGGQGMDALTGGLGADTFVYAAGDTVAKTGKYDTITDFMSGVDRIDIGTFNGSPGSYAETTVASSNIVDGAAAAQALASGGVSAVFVAGTSNGWLFWDDTGDFILDQVILLTGASSTSVFSGSDIF